MEYAVVGRNIYPGMVVDVLVERKETIDPCPGIFRAIHVESGSAFVSVDGGKRFLEAPSLLCLDGREEIEFLKAEGFSCRTAYFKPSVINFQLSRDIALLPANERYHSPFMPDLIWLDPFIDRSPGGKAFLLDPSAAERVTALLDILAKSLEEQADAFWPCRSRSYFLELLFFLSNLSGARIGGDAPESKALAAGLDAGLPGKIEDVLLYLHANFRENIELEKLCKRFAINRTSLNGLFRNHLGQTVIQYLIGLRVRFSCFLLRDTTVPVKELVWRSGFNELAHFNRTFKKITSMTPLEYRKEHCFMLKG